MYFTPPEKETGCGIPELKDRDRQPAIESFFLCLVTILVRLSRKRGSRTGQRLSLHLGRAYADQALRKHKCNLNLQMQKWKVREVR